MNYPFDIGFTSAPGVNDFHPVLGTTYTHNSTDATIDLNLGGFAVGGLLLKSTPVESNLTFGAEVMFTANNAGTANNFGLRLNIAPETTNQTCYVASNINNTIYPTGNKWFFDKIDISGNSYGSLFPYRQVGAPVFALNTWFDLKIEYARVPFYGIGSAVIRFWVNGTMIGEYRDASVVAGPVTPGIFLNAGKLKVRRMYADLTPALTPIYPYITTERKQESFPITGSSANNNVRQELNADATRTSGVNDSDLTIRGRTLGDDFIPFQENVFVMRTDTMEVLQRVTADEDGYYTFSRLDSKFDYRVFVKRDGIPKTVPMADYIGYGELAGTYRIRGETVGGVEVRVFSEQTGEYLGMVMTDSSGRFSIPNVNKAHLFALVFREPSGAWEDRVSSRRLPEIVGGVLTFINTATENASGNGISGNVKIIGGREPYSVTVTGLPAGLGYTLTGDTITFQGTSGAGGVYSVTISAMSIDDKTGTTTFNVNIASGFDSIFSYIDGETMVATLAPTIVTASQDFATNPGAIGTWADTYADSGSLSATWQSAGVWNAQATGYNNAFILKGGEYGNDMLATIETTIVAADYGNFPLIGFFAIPQTAANMAFATTVTTGSSNTGYIHLSNSQTSPALAVTLGTTAFTPPKTGRHKYQLRMKANGPAMRIEYLIDDVVVMTYDPSASDIPSTQKYKIGVFIRSSSHDFHMIDVKSYR